MEREATEPGHNALLSLLAGCSPLFCPSSAAAARFLALVDIVEGRRRLGSLGDWSEWRGRERPARWPQVRCLPYRRALLPPSLPPSFVPRGVWTEKEMLKTDNNTEGGEGETTGDPPVCKTDGTGGDAESTRLAHPADATAVALVAWSPLSSVVL